MDFDNFCHLAILLKNVPETDMQRCSAPVNDVLNFLNTYLERRNVVTSLRSQAREYGLRVISVREEYDEVAFGPEGPRGLSDEEVKLNTALRNARKHLRRTAKEC